MDGRAARHGPSPPSIRGEIAGPEASATMTGRIAPLAVAVLCIAAIGVSATTLDSSLSTDPKDEIDPDYEALPISEGLVVELFQEFHPDVEPPEDAKVEEPPEEKPPREQPPEGEPPENVDGPEGASGADDAGSQSGGGGNGDTGFGLGGGEEAGEDEESARERLLGLLASLARALLPLLVVLALAVRYRDRLPAPLSGEEDPNRRSAAWPEADPPNAVDRAWLAMVRQIEPERPGVMTPAECARAAREAGLDPEAVEAITAAFERVHYGGVPIAAEQRRAERGLRRLRDGTGRRADGRRGRDG